MIAPGVVSVEIVLVELALALPLLLVPPAGVISVDAIALPINVLLFVALAEMSAVIQKYKVVELLKGLVNVNVWVPVAGLVIVANKFVVAKEFEVV